jgi:putative endopeptidase
MLSLNLDVVVQAGRWTRGTEPWGDDKWGSQSAVARAQQKADGGFSVCKWSSADARHNLAKDSGQTASAFARTFMKTLWLCAAAAGALSISTADAQGPAPDLSQAPRMGPWGFDTAGQDTSVKPGDDFFRYADGKAVDKLAIPPDRARFGAFDQLYDLSEARSRAVIEAPGSAAANTDEGKIKALYASFMNQGRLEALGAAPLEPELAAIKAAKTRSDLARLMGKDAASFYGSFFGVYIGDDAKDPQHYAVILSQGGLGLPDRDYYLTPQFAEKKAAYQTYIAATLARIGWLEPEAQAKAIVDLETEIAKVSWTRVDQRDDDKTYNPTTPAALAKTAPGFDWQAFFAGADLASVKRVIVSEDTAFPKIAALYAQTPLPVLRAWAAYTLTDGASSYLSKAFDEAHFDFRSKTLSGVPQQRERWKRAASVVSGQMGEALGRVYVEKFFPADSKAQMLSLVGDLRTALGERIKRLDWMSDATKAKALEKLAKFNVKIAYPDKWRDYSKLVVKPDDLFGNIERGQAFEWAYRVGRLNGPVDRSEWEMLPQTVNAYYSPTKNEVVFPAAILQPPFFDPKADPAINYGAIGGVIGHEMTHGFDDQGRKYDGDGRLADWWTKEDAERFEARAKVLADQYSAFEPLPGAHVNGQLTLGENIADLGGLLLALDAYHASLHGRPAPVIDGLTGDQRVFLGWAQDWRSKLREEALRRQIATNPHSPDPLRVNGVVHNVPGWYDAYGVKPGDKLYLAPDQRVKIW